MQYRKLTELKKLPNNPRIIRDKQFRTLCDSIRDNPEYFEARPVILSNRTGELVIIAGNQRYEAAKALKLKEVPTYLIEGLTEAKEREIIIRDNISNGEFDLDILANGWDDLPLLDWGLDLPADWLKEEETVGDAEPQMDKAAELNKIWKVKTGDLWQIGEHRLLCGDSTKKEDVGRVMGGEKAEFCFTSPPYSDQRDYSGKLELNPKHLAKFLAAPCDLFAVNLGMKRKDNEVDAYWDDYIAAAREYGHKFLSWNIWSREDSGYTVGQITAMFAIDHEWILIFGKPKKLNLTVPNKDAGEFNDHSTQRQKDGKTTKPKSVTIRNARQLGTVVRINTELARNKDFDHPAPFPIALPQEYIKACSGELGLVFEPFAGSGSTMVACQNLNRKCRGIEISPQYVAVCLERMFDAFGIKGERIE